MKKEAGFMNLLKEVARDLIALGGVPFFLLILARIWQINKPWYFWELVIGGVVFLIISGIFKFKAEVHMGLATVALFFVSMYYMEMQFTVLASALYLCLIGALIWNKYDKKSIFFGFIAGVVSTGISYFVSRMFFL